jgi:hypothetical protein
MKNVHVKVVKNLNNVVSMSNLQKALSDPLWINHKIGNTYSMDGKGGWKIAYYPIFEDGKTKEVYKEPRALVEKLIGKEGIDFREVPLRYLRLVNSL